MENNNVWKNIFLNVLQSTGRQAIKGNLRKPNTALGSVLAGIEGGLVQTLVEEEFGEDGFLRGAVGGGAGGFTSGLLTSLFTDDDMIGYGLTQSAIGAAIGGARETIRRHNDMYRYVLPAPSGSNVQLVSYNSRITIDPNCKFVFDGETARYVFYLTSPYNSQLILWMLNENKRTETAQFIKSKLREEWRNVEYKKNVYKYIIPDFGSGISGKHVKKLQQVFRDFPYVAAFAENPNYQTNDIAFYFLLGVPDSDKAESLTKIREPYALTRWVVKSDTMPKPSDIPKLPNIAEIAIKWFKEQIKNAGVYHVETTIRASFGASRFLGGNVSDTFGIGFDGYGNVALYGNVNIYGYLNGKGIQYFDYKNMVKGGIDNAIKNYRYSQSIGGGLSCTRNISWDFRMENLKELFGLATSASWSVDIDGVSAGLNFNYNGKEEFVGLGINFGLGVGVPFDYTMEQEYNKGVIISIEELPLLLSTNVKFEAETLNRKVEFDVEDGRLTWKIGTARIKTTIDAEMSEDNSHIISLKAKSKYKYEK